MTKQTVKVKSSSAIQDVTYNDQTKVLSVHMQPGTKGGNDRSDYADVPKEVFEEFLKADSKGRFYNTRIRNNYQFLG